MLLLLTEQQIRTLTRIGVGKLALGLLSSGNDKNAFADKYFYPSTSCSDEYLHLGLDAMRKFSARVSILGLIA
jgi:hypothetical protein